MFLRRLLPDNFTLTLLAVVLAATLLPASGQIATVFEWITNLAIALLFFLGAWWIALIALVAGAFGGRHSQRLVASPLVMATAKDIVAGKTVARRIIGKDGVYPMETAAKEFPSRQY